MKALVTGAAGLIGSHVVRALESRGHKVRAMVRHKDRVSALPATHADAVVADVLRFDDALRAACSDCDVVFHTAAYFSYFGHTPAQLFATAVDGTENILRASAEAGVSRVVVTSSSIVFGYSELPAIVRESAGLVQRDGEPPYITAKLAQDRRALDLADELSLDVVIACPTITIGPSGGKIGPSNGIIASYLADPFRCTYPGGCNAVRARDVAEGHVILAERGAPRQHYLLGSENLDWREIHSIIAELAGISAPRIELDHKLAYVAAAAEELRAHFGGRAPLTTREQAGMIGRWYWYAHDRAAKLGYTPAPTRQALIETVSWLVASSHISREIRAGLRLSPEIYQFRGIDTNGCERGPS